MDPTNLIIINISYTDIDDCLGGPCENNATCTDRINAYQCECFQGFTGTNCETSTLIPQYGVIYPNQKSYEPFEVYFLDVVTHFLKSDF